MVSIYSPNLHYNIVNQSVETGNHQLHRTIQKTAAVIHEGSPKDTLADYQQSMVRRIFIEVIF